MVDSLMYEEETFVVLEPDRGEQFLTATELLEKLKPILRDRLETLPPDVKKLPSVDEQAQYLINTYCDLDVGPGRFLQWYAVRLEK